MADAKPDTHAINIAETATAQEKPKLKKIATFQTPDGKVFQTQREASEHLRGYLVDDALKTLVGTLEKGKVIDWEWLKANKEAVIKAYDAAKVERAPVTEETKAKMKLSRSMSPEQRAAAKAKEEAAKKAAAEAKAKAEAAVAAKGKK